MYLYGFFQNFAPAKRDPGRTIEGSRLAGMKLFTCNRKISYEEFITLSRSRQNGKEFHPVQPGSCNHHLAKVIIKMWSHLHKDAKSELVSPLT